MGSILQAMLFRHSPAERINEYKDLGVKIGKNVFIDYMVWMDSYYEGITIEDHCCICYNVTILSHDSSLAVITDFPVMCKETHIGKNVYLGTGCTIMPGVKIGENSIIGVGSVVTKDIPPNSVAYGHPCRVVKTIEQFYSEKKSEMMTNPESIKYMNHVPESRPPINEFPTF